MAHPKRGGPGQLPPKARASGSRHRGCVPLYGWLIVHTTLTHCSPTGGHLSCYEYCCGEHLCMRFRVGRIHIAPGHEPRSGSAGHIVTLHLVWGSTTCVPTSSLAPTPPHACPHCQRLTCSFCLVAVAHPGHRRGAQGLGAEPSPHWLIPRGAWASGHLAIMVQHLLSMGRRTQNE